MEKATYINDIIFFQKIYFQALLFPISLSPELNLQINTEYESDSGIQDCSRSVLKKIRSVLAVQNIHNSMKCKFHCIIPLLKVITGSSWLLAMKYRLITQHTVLYLLITNSRPSYLAVLPNAIQTSAISDLIIQPIFFTSMVLNILIILYKTSLTHYLSPLMLFVN